jgi:hypothetical protein
MADFGENDASTQRVDAGNGGQELDRGAKGLDQSVDLRIDLVDRRVTPAPAKAGGRRSVADAGPTGSGVAG